MTCHRPGPTTDAVMARRAPKAVAEAEAVDDPQTALFRTLDFYPSPPWSARAGAEVLLELDPGPWVVREPACGKMHMAGPLAEYFPEVLPTDVHPHSPNTPLRDWLDPYAWADEPDCDWVVTNPPFAIADQFVKLGLQRARRGVALLLRTVFLEGGGRYPLMAGADPLTVLAPFSERVPMTLGAWKPEASSATSYSWFFWMKGAEPRAPRFIGPGTRERLWMPGDADKYGLKTPMPLFDWEDAIGVAP